MQVTLIRGWRQNSKTYIMIQFNFLFLLLTMGTGNVSTSSLINNDLIIENSAIKMIVESDAAETYFEELGYNEKSEGLNYKTSEIVDAIRILNVENKIIYHLPIGTNDISINKSLFEKGIYTLYFMKGDETIETSIIVVK